jgi:hypothetical protein
MVDDMHTLTALAAIVLAAPAGFAAIRIARAAVEPEATPSRNTRIAAATTAAAAVLLVGLVPLGRATVVSIDANSPLTFAALLIGVTVLAATFCIDAATQYVPPPRLMRAAAAAVIVLLTVDRAVLHAAGNVAGAFAGAAVLFGMAFVIERAGDAWSRHRNGGEAVVDPVTGEKMMFYGDGDKYILLLAGALLGTVGGLAVFFLATMISGLFSAATISANIIRRRPLFGSTFALGPFYIAAFALVLVLGSLTPLGPA